MKIEVKDSGTGPLALRNMDMAGRLANKVSSIILNPALYQVIHHLHPALPYI
jgi:fatty acid desaturase